MTFNFFILMLGLQDLDFCNMDLIYHLNSRPRVCRRLKMKYISQHMPCQVWNVDTWLKSSNPLHWLLPRNLWWYVSKDWRQISLNQKFGKKSLLFCWSYNQVNLQIWLSFSGTQSRKPVILCAICHRQKNSDFLWWFIIIVHKYLNCDTFSKNLFVFFFIILTYILMMRHQHIISFL
jgi:hypothetical protein